MLRFRLATADLAGLRWPRAAENLLPPGRFGPHGLSFGSSFIEPFRHRAVSASLLRAPSATAVIVAEQPEAGQGLREVMCSDGELADRLQRAHAPPRELISVEIQHGNGGVIVTAGLCGAAPIYLTMRGDALLGDWDAGALLRAMPERRLDRVLAVAALTDGGLPYSARTLFSDLRLLTERGRAYWHPGEDIDIVYPPAAQRPRPRALKPDADVPGAFIAVLRRTMQRWLAPGAPAFCELSGGLDSAIVAGIARTLTDDVSTFGLELDGAMGAAQRERRRVLAAHFGFADHALAASDYPPFGANGAPHRLTNPLPWAECYLEGFGVLLGNVGGNGGNTIATGLGGDELFHVRWDELSASERAIETASVTAERHPPDFVTAVAARDYVQGISDVDRAPPAPLVTSALQGAAAAAPLYLRQGIWPVSPLAAPDVVQFCASLPLAWRAQRRLERDTLARWGLPKSVTHPDMPETFSPLMTAALRGAARSLLDRLFAEPALADLGLVEGKRLAQAYAAYCAGERHDEWPFYAAAMLELTLRGEEAVGSLGWDRTSDHSINSRMLYR